MTTTTKKRVLNWSGGFYAPKDSTKADPYTVGVLSCFVIEMGHLNGKLKIDCRKMDPNYGKLNNHGKRLFAHGVKQKWSDKIAGKSPAETYTIMRDFAPVLESGTWSSERETAVARNMNRLISAYAMREYGVDFTDDQREMANVAVSGLDKETIAKLRASPKIKKFETQIELAELQAASDAANKDVAESDEEVEFTL